MTEPRAAAEGPIARTSKLIAFCLLGLYGLLLVIIGLVAAWKPEAEAKAWVDLLKSGFLILGGALTSVIGYYFGSRGTQEAAAIAEAAKRETTEARAALEAEKDRLASLEDQLSPTWNEVSGLDEPVAPADEE